MKNIWILGLVLMIASCAGEEEKPENGTKEPAHIPAAKIESPLNDDQYVVGDPLVITLELNKPNEVSSMAIYVDDTKYAENIDKSTRKIEIDTKNSKVGFVEIKLVYKDKDGKEFGDTRKVVFFSDIVPDQKTAEIVKSYPHNNILYTQGLEFFNGRLFESTGQWGQSAIYELDLSSGNLIRQSETLSQSYFGEGITILNDTIYQLTWQSNICNVYDLNFNKLTTFTYSGEGWGLCNDGEYIIMTNGTSEIVWRDRRTFEVVKRIYAFDDQSEIDNLNEIELIDGKLWANVYTENYIVEIDTATGKVLSDIDCTDLVNDAMGAEVLNGIARNSQTGKIYMTGKLWPKIYEIKVK